MLPIILCEGTINEKAIDAQQILIKMAICNYLLSRKFGGRFYEFSNEYLSEVVSGDLRLSFYLIFPSAEKCMDFLDYVKSL